MVLLNGVAVPSAENTLKPLNIVSQNSPVRVCLDKKVRVGSTKQNYEDIDIFTPNLLCKKSSTSFILKNHSRYRAIYNNKRETLRYDFKVN